MAKNPTQNPPTPAPDAPAAPAAPAPAPAPAKSAKVLLAEARAVLAAARAAAKSEAAARKNAPRPPANLLPIGTPICIGGRDGAITGIWYDVKFADGAKRVISARKVAAK